MANEYGRFAPQMPRSLQQNRNSAIASPRSRQPAGTQPSTAGNEMSATRKAMNMPGPLQPGGHRQTPYGGRTNGPSANMGQTPNNPMYNPNGSGQSPVSQNPDSGPGMNDPFQAQMAMKNKLMNRGGYGMEMPKGNYQSPPPGGIYTRPSNQMRY